MIGRKLTENVVDNILHPFGEVIIYAGEEGSQLGHMNDGKKYDDRDS